MVLTILWVQYGEYGGVVLCEDGAGIVSLHHPQSDGQVLTPLIPQIIDDEDRAVWGEGGREGGREGERGREGGRERRGREREGGREGERERGREKGGERTKESALTLL